MPRGSGEDRQHPFHPVGRTDETPSEPSLPAAKLKVGPGGRVVIPVAMRNALGVGEGDVLVARLHGDELRLASMKVMLERAREIVREVIPPGVRLSVELLEDRRREVERERGE